MRGALLRLILLLVTLGGQRIGEARHPGPVQLDGANFGDSRWVTYGRWVAAPALHPRPSAAAPAISSRRSAAWGSGFDDPDGPSWLCDWALGLRARSDCAHDCLEQPVAPDPAAADVRVGTALNSVVCGSRSEPYTHDDGVLDLANGSGGQRIGEARHLGPTGSYMSPLDDPFLGVGEYPECGDVDCWDVPRDESLDAAGGDEAPPSLAWDDGGPMVPDYIEADAFGGGRPGMVFKSGQHGIGYYRDAPLTACAVWAAEQSAGAEQERLALTEYLAPLCSGHLDLHGRDKRTLTLSDLLLDGDAERCSSLTRRRAPRKVRRARGKRQRGRGGVESVWNPLTLFGTAKADISHREAGAWAFDSYNGNAMATAHAFLEQSGADVCFVQESRVAGDKLLAAERNAAKAGWSLALEAAADTDAGSFSAGVGVAVRSHLGHAKSPLWHGDSRLEHRVKFSWMGGIIRGGLHLVSAYFWTAEGLSQRNLALLDSLAKALRRLHGPWVLAADWNFTPQELVATGWLNLVKGCVQAPSRPTCGLKEYDFFVIDARLRPAVVGVSLVCDTGAKPHSAVRLWLRRKPRRHMVRVLRPPRKANPLLPRGCLNSDAGKG